MALSAGRRWLNAVLKKRIISELSLLTIVPVFLSQSTGTVNLRSHAGNEDILESP